MDVGLGAWGSGSRSVMGQNLKAIYGSGVWGFGFRCFGL